MFIFFDTETTGLPKDWRAPMTDLNNWPRVIQLAFLVTNDKGEDLYSDNFLIKPDGWEIPAEKFWIDNGFSTERSLRDGVPIGTALYSFVLNLQNCPFLISHNMDFDYNVLGAELLRENMVSENKPTRICTKEVSTEYCAIPFEGRRQYPGMGQQRFKWPKLSELHKKLFGKDFEGAHDALADVRALKDCFFGLIKVGVIKIKA